MATLSNGILSIEVSAHGAELQSLKRESDNTQYLWQGDERWWNRRSPLLFPLCGSLWEGKTRILGREWKIEKHGFLRDAAFRLVQESPDSLVYETTDNALTRALFPWPFRLRQRFTLREASLEVAWEVSTPADTAMPFHIGGHPSFFFRGWQEGEELKGYFSFTPKEGSDEPLSSAEVGALGCLGRHRHTLALDSAGRLPVSDALFRNDAVILDRNQISAVTLHSAQGEPILRVRSGAPVTLIWSPYDVESPFLCIEPWYGLCDSEREHRPFAERPYTNLAQPGEVWQGGYTIDIL